LQQIGIGIKKTTTQKQNKKRSKSTLTDTMIARLSKSLSFSQGLQVVRVPEIQKRQLKSNFYIPVVVLVV
jgi:hypothetical protein